MSPGVVTFIFETVNFVLLALALGWVFTKPMRKMLDDEVAARAKVEKEAGDRATQLAHAEADLAKKLADARSEAEREKERLGAEAEKNAGRILDEARAQAAEERARMDREAESRQRAGMDALAGEVGKAAAKVVLDVFASGAAPEADAVFARAAREQLAAMVAQDSGHVVIECARPPNDETRAALRAAIGTALDRAEIRVVPGLVAGVRVTSDMGLVDASARGLARHTEAALAHGGAASHG